MTKKIIFSFVLIISMLISTSCIKTENIIESTDVSEQVYSEETEDNNNAVISSGCFYGERTGTDKTYTGLEPLPFADFTIKDPVNKKGLPVKTIDHSFGVASDEKPNDVSINNQKFLDEKGYNAIVLDVNPDAKYVYLTFDCGYENGYTGKILDALKEKNVKAAFFCTLPQVKENPGIIARMINEGHIVGNHSVTHPDFSKLTREQMTEEIKGFDNYLREHFGYSSLFFRYPQGKYSEDSLDLINSFGYKCVFWSIAYADWDVNNLKGGKYAHDTVISRIHPGAIILLHAVSPDNAAGIRDIIDTARNMGYEFRSLDTLK